MVMVEMSNGNWRFRANRAGTGWPHGPLCLLEDFHDDDAYEVIVCNDELEDSDALDQ